MQGGLDDGRILRGGGGVVCTLPHQDCHCGQAYLMTDSKFYPFYNNIPKGGILLFLMAIISKHSNNIVVRHTQVASGGSQLLRIKELNLVLSISSQLLIYIVLSSFSSLVILQHNKTLKGGFIWTLWAFR